MKISKYLLGNLFYSQQREKERLKYHKEKEKEREKEREREYQLNRDKRQALLAESELIYAEFLDVMFIYFLKKVQLKACLTFNQ